jgi:dihydrolipoamide dehydrogenase
VELYEEVTRRGPELGLAASGLSVDWARLQKRKGEVVARLVGGVEALLRAKGVLIVRGRAKRLGPKEALVEGPGGRKEKYQADAVILATGSKPFKPRVPGFDLPGILTSDEALDLPAPPESLLVVGGGVIGLELASVFAPLGTKTTVVELLPDILPNVDAELVALVRAQLAADGLDVHVGAKVKSVRRADDGSFATLVEPAEGPGFELRAQAVLVATGRLPNTADLGLEALGVEMAGPRIAVDSRLATSLPGLYAIGDCSSPIMLAHVASREGEVAVDNILGREVRMDHRRVPGAIYTNPEIAWVGLSEAQARERGLSVSIGRFPLAFNGKSLVMGSEGLFKTVIDAGTGELVGVHLIGPRATDLIAAASTAMGLEATAEDLAEVIHAHPTVAEALGESLLDAMGRAVHKM